jgi:hypothetical protein
VAVVVVRTGGVGTSVQERFERSRAGRVVISLFVLAILVGLLTANLPASYLQGKLLNADHSYFNALDLDQDWGVFAPDPRQETVDVFARVTFADGSTETWQVPRRNPVVGEYIDYRWLKWEEWVVAPALVGELPRPAAIYVARRLATPTRRPVRVALVDRSHPIPPLGQPTAPTPPSDSNFYSTSITEAMLRGASG